MSLGKKSKSQVERLREKVYKRDGYGCVACRVIFRFENAFRDDLTIQHRVSRGMGGSARYDTSMAFLISFCAGHNLAETAEAKFAQQCIDYGWAVPRWVVDRGWPIETVPVRYHDGWWMLDDVDRVPVTDKIARDRMLEIYGPEFGV